MYGACGFLQNQLGWLSRLPGSIKPTFIAEDAEYVAFGTFDYEETVLGSLELMSVFVLLELHHWQNTFFQLRPIWLCPKTKR